MLPRNHPDRIRIVFDDHRLVANAGLLLPATLARHLGLRELVDHHLDLGGAPGRANTGDKLMTLVASAMAGGDCIDDADVLRTGGTACTLGGTVKAPSTLGTFLRSFRWGYVRQLDRVSRELLARAWAAGAGPGDVPFTIDLDSTICETYGLAKEGARHHGYTGAGKTRLTPPTSCGRRWDGYAMPGPTDDSRRCRQRVLHSCPWYPSAARWMSGFSITGQHKSLAISSRRIPECLDSHYWMDGAADVAECRTPFQSEPDGTGAAHRPAWAHARFPAGPLRLLQLSRLITDRDGEMLELEADHRRHAEIENAIRDLKHGVGLNHLPSGRFNAAWLAVQVMAHNLARWGQRASVWASRW